jgi:hypothetical protein
MDQKRRRIDRSKYEEMKKPVYVLSDLYDDISSEEEEYREPTEHLLDDDDLEEISVGSVDWNFIDNILGESDSPPPVMAENADSRGVIVAGRAEREDGGGGEVGDEDDDDVSGREKVGDTDEEDTRSVIICDTDSSSDESDNITRINKSTICLILNKSQRFYPNGMEEVERETQVIYSEDIDPDQINARDIADEILEEVPRHFAAGRVRIVRGNFSD